MFIRDSIKYLFLKPIHKGLHAGNIADGSDESFHFKEILPLGILLCLAALAYIGAFDWIIDFAGRGHVKSINQQYLALELVFATEMMEILSAIKIPLAILSSASGGISFGIDVNVQLGEALRVFNDLIDLAWCFSLVSMVALHFLQVLNELSSIAGKALLTLFFSILGFAVFSRNILPAYTQVLGRAAYLILFIVLFTHIVAPMVVYVTAISNHQYFHGEKTELRNSFHEQMTHMPGDHQGGHLHDQVKFAIDSVHSGTANSQNKKHMPSIVARHSTLVLFESVVIPIGLLAAFSWFAFVIIQSLREKGLP